MIVTRDEALAEMQTRRFPPIFPRIWNRQIPLALAGTCAEPRRYFQLAPSLRTALPKAEGFLPLYETNLEAIVAYDMTNDAYVRYYYSDPADEVLGKSYQQFLSALFLELADSGVDDDALTELAAEFGYQHLEELKEFLDTVDPDDYEAANRRFINSIP